MTDNKAMVRGGTTALALTDQLQYAQAFFESGLFKDVQSAAQALVKIEAGREVGLAPMAAMTGFDIVQGRVRMTAATCAALVNACHYADYKPVSSDAKQCTIAFSRKTREGWVDLPPVTYTIEIAHARGGDKSPEWQADPQNMLYWRALQRGVNYYFPELLKGMAADIDLPTPSKIEADEASMDLFGAPVEVVDQTTGEVIDAEVEPEPEAKPKRASKAVKVAPGFEGHEPTERDKLLKHIGDACEVNELNKKAVQVYAYRMHNAEIRDMSEEQLAEVLAKVSAPDDELKNLLADIEIELADKTKA